MPEVDPFGVGRGFSKADKRKRDVTNSALTGAGATTAGVGFVAGGLPGVKSDVGPLSSMKPSTETARTRTQRASDRARHAKAGFKAGRGGILGFRASNHEGGTYGFKQKATMGEWYPSDKAKEAFAQGRHRGKVAPEETIIRHIKGGKKAAGAAMAGGGLTVAYGQRDKIKSKINKSQSREKWDKRSGAALGVGGAGLAITGGTGALLRNQERRWGREAAKSEDAAAKLVPGLRGKSDKDIVRNPKVFDNVEAKTAREAGQFRGAATQQRHFAHVYGDTGKIVRRFRTPTAALGAAGAGGLIASRKKDPVKKNYSAFGVEHHVG